VHPRRDRRPRQAILRALKWPRRIDDGKGAARPQILRRDRRGVEAHRPRPAAERSGAHLGPRRVAAGDDDGEVAGANEAIDEPAAEGAGAADHQYGPRHGSTPPRAAIENMPH
jgi:hypothetical protein